MEPQKEIRLQNAEIRTQSTPESGFSLPKVEAGERARFNQEPGKRESLAEQASKIVEISKGMPQTAPIVQADDSAQTVVSAGASTTQAPAAASDGDLMEKEWVNDLKKMIGETKNDPHEREQRFRNMQIDYLKKRYGRIIGGGN